MFDKKLIKNFDFLILILISLLVGFGLIGIGVAMREPVQDDEYRLFDMIGNFNLHYVKLHLLWFGVGLVAMLVVLSVDYHLFAEMSPYIYWTVVAMLLYVFFRGHIAGNARSWISFGSFYMQPSEFAKISMIISLAKAIAKKKDEGEGLNSIKDLLPLLGRLVIPLALIIDQPDFGTAMVFIAIFFGMIFVAGISYKLLLGTIGAGVAAVPLMWYGLLSDTQKNRILVFLNPGMDPLGAGYHVIQSIIAIGSGRIWGKGILTDNTLSQLNYVPAKNTDFIFSVTVEALGFVGGAIIICLYLCLILRTIYLATKAKDNFGSFLVIGVVSMMVFHIFENIGMTIGLMPITGIPLPFMSYGGSSMITNMIAYGLVLNVGMRRQKINF
ncbi:MAG: rod shape-determining protein RodA [Caldicoprobacter sp.]|uniref:rod shape-determining protein RodA n=1 Tax=Caldicoprobacter sp. TaxID=2004500 RepID=UPI001D435E4B|nr:rod shape-determining protein RodA [Clostridia bacterium]